MTQSNFTKFSAVALLCAAFAAPAHAQSASAATESPPPASEPKASEQESPAAAPQAAAKPEAQTQPGATAADAKGEAASPTTPEPKPPTVAVFELEDAPPAVTTSLREAFGVAGASVIVGAQKTPQQKFGTTCGKDAACRTTSFSVYPADAGLFGNGWVDSSTQPPQQALSVVFATEKRVLWEATFFEADVAALSSEASFIASRAMAAWMQAQEAKRTAEATAAAEDKPTETAPRVDEDEYEDAVAEDGTRIWPEGEAPAEAGANKDDKFAQKEVPAETVEEGSAVLFWSWIAGFVVVGAAAGACGVLFDLFSPTSTNDQLDIGDGVGPALVIAGAAFAVVGVLFNPFSLPEEGDS